MVQLVVGCSGMTSGVAMTGTGGGAPVGVIVISASFALALNGARNARYRCSAAIVERRSSAQCAYVVVRFGAHLESLKGRPVDSKLFFRGEAPSVLARRRLTKLAAATEHIVDEFENHKDKIRDQTHWRSEFKNAFDDLSALQKQQRASRVEKVVLAPEVAAGREAWLATYNANKNRVRGLLAYAGKPELLPLFFDDLAETHRVSGVSDEPAPPAPETP